MKKSLVFIPFFMLLFLSGMDAYAQYKYKVEARVNALGSHSATGLDVNTYLVTPPAFTSSDRILSYQVEGCRLNTTRGGDGANMIVTSNIEYTHINIQTRYTGPGTASTCRRSGTTNQRIPIDCYDDSDIPGLFPTASRGYLRITKLSSLAELNDYNTTGNLLTTCSTKTLIAGEGYCTDHEMTYGVEYQIANSTTWETLIPNGLNVLNFSFAFSDFVGLNTGENLRIRINYGIGVGFSDILTYIYLPCPPTLDSTVPSDVACFDSNDGGVRLTFDRPLASGEQFRATLSGITPEGFTIPEADAIANSFGTGNTYDWTNNLVAGDYTLTYQTFILNGPGPGDDTPTSTGESGTFTIRRPGMVTVGITSTVQPQCIGDTGAVTLSASGGQDLESGTYQYSRNNGAWQSSPAFNNLPQGSNNTFRSRLALSGGRYCISPTPTGTVSINTITNGITVTSASVDTPPSYPGANDGAIRINTSGGSPNRTYRASGPVTRSITNSLSTGVVGGLPAGTYAISVTDGNGCTANYASNVTLTAVPVPTIGAPNITIPISCNGVSDGSVAIPISGGISPYNFQWRLDGTLIETGSTGTSFVRSGLEAGNYTLTVSSTDANINVAAATDSRSFSLAEPQQLLINSATANDIRCFGGNDGSIDASVSGGTAPYRYRLSHTGGFTTASGSSFSIQVTSPGSYPLYIRDANDCQVVFGSNLTVSQPTAAITINEVVASHVDNIVHGGSAGSLEIAVANNNGIGLVSWTRDGNAFTPPVGSTTTLLVGLPAGSYDLTFADLSGCTGTLNTPIVITEPGPLEITSITGTNIDCNGDATGTISAVVTGTPPLSYVWERQGDPGFTAPNSPNLTGLPAGTYTLRLTDATAAPEVTDTVTLTQPTAAVGGTATATDSSCNGSDNGSITVNATGGTGAYTYALDGGSYQTGNTFNALPPANYTITIRDTNGCTFDIPVTINQPQPINVITDAIDHATSSGGTDGAISISITGGTTPYGITWSGPGTYTSNNEDITGLIAGSYTLQIRDAGHTTDASGCYFIQNFTVTEPGPLAIDNIDVTDVDCKGDGTGSITVTAIGNPPIQYVWELDGSIIPGADTNILNNIGAGTYTITIDDPTANPTVSQNITVNEPSDDLTATGVAFEVSCFSGNDGEIQINASGGTTPYSYSLDGTNFQNGYTFTGLGEGSYIATVRDANGCEFLLPNDIFVNAPQEMGLLIDQQRDLSAANASDGAISITPFGGTAPYTYSWTADNGFTSADQDITDLAGGNYTLVIRDANYNTTPDNGCTYSQTFAVFEPELLVVDITQTVELECYGDAFAELEAIVQGGVQPYSYQWFQIIAGNDTPLTEDTEILAGLSIGEYFVRVTDANSISADAPIVVVTEPGELAITVDSVTDIVCLDALTGAIDISVSGGTPPYSYTWDNGITTEDLTGIPAGNYNIEVVDDNNCFTDIDITVDPPADPLTLDNITITDASAYLASDGAIAMDIIGGTLPYIIQWTNSNGTVIGDTATITGLTADDYTLSVNDANGCNITQNYMVGQPDIVEETITPPICNGDANGSISLIVNQGNGTFTYSWSNGETTQNISGLAAGSYTVTINGLPNGEVVRTYEVLDPVPLVVDLGGDRVLCAGQVLELDATLEDPGAIYQWSSDNGFASNEPVVTLTEAGNYSLTLSLPTGCTATGSINVDTTDLEISAEFAVSSQVFTGENLLAVDISYPLPDTLVWNIPQEGELIKQDADELELVFDQPGEYEIGIVTTRGDCIAERTKTVLVVDRDNTVPDDGKQDNIKTITDFLIFPNPTSGTFTAQVELPERGNISIKVFGFANNKLITSETQRGERSYSIEFDISGTPPGVYAVLLETPIGDQLQKIIVR